MANTTIPNLPMAISLSGAEQIEIVQAGVSKRATLSQISTAMIGYPLAGIAVSTGSSWGTSFNSGNPVTVSFGGTGLITLSSNYLYKGAGTSPLVQSVIYDDGANVGIGTSSPGSYGSLATVKNATGVTTVAVSNSNASTNDGAKFASFYSTTEITSVGHYWNGSQFIGRVYSYGDLTFLGTATPTELMRLTATGTLALGTSSPSSSAILEAQSTSKGVRFPNMTTAQKNAISSPAVGLVVFDTTLAKLCVYTGAAWQTITSV